MENTLYFGDNLDILRAYVPDESVDLIYLDPPFNSKGAYNLLYKDERGDAPASWQVFEDTWVWNERTARFFEEEILFGAIPDTVRRTLQAFGQFLGTTPMMAYLTMMTPRLVEMRRVLKPTGSLYLHCDPSASHYLKIILDTIFGPTNFKNEIIWKRKTGRGDTGGTSKRFGTATDILLFYGKTNVSTFNTVYRPNNPDYLDKFFRYTDDHGRRYRIDNLASPSPRPNLTYEYKGYKPPAFGWAISREKMEQWDAEGRLAFPKSKDGRIQRKRYLDELKGEQVQNLWDDISAISAQAAERLGYPTQKPLALLERIITASSNPGDVILDPFCGCGTAVDAAQQLGRRWLGIDIAVRAISIIEERLHLTHGLAASVDYTLTGRPQDEESARKLATHGGASQGGYRFEDWALDLVRAEPWTGKTKRGKDRGCDGVIVFRDSETKVPHRILVQVKSGQDRKPAHVRDLRGTMDREEVEMGVLLTLEQATPEMKLEAATAGFYTDPATNAKAPRIQILTVGDILERGARVELPEGSFIISRRIGRKTEVLPPAQRVLIPALPLSEPSNVIRVATKSAKERRKKGQTG